MESVEKDHVRDGVHETPTVCGTPGTPHDMDVDTDGEVDTSSSLRNRAPSTQRVINEIKMLDDIQTPIRHSPIFDEGNQHILFQLSFWNEINSKLIDSLSACAVTVAKGAKKAALSYAKERALIDAHAAGMIKHEAFSSLDMTAPEVRRHVSLLLQIIAIEYTEAFGKLISYKGQGGGNSVRQKVCVGPSPSSTTPTPSPSSPNPR